MARKPEAAPRKDDNHAVKEEEFLSAVRTHDKLEENVVAAREARSRFRKELRTRGLKLKSFDKVVGEREIEPRENKADIIAEFQMRRWLRIPHGTQAELFPKDAEPASIDTCEVAGFQAGIAGKDRKPPAEFQSGKQQQAWLKSYDEGQQKLGMDMFGKKDFTKAPTPAEPVEAAGPSGKKAKPAAAAAAAAAAPAPPAPPAGTVEKKVEDAAEADYQKAVAAVVKSGVANVAKVQKELNLSYNAAGHLIERMEAEGIVSKIGEDGKRTLLRKAAEVVPLKPPGAPEAKADKPAIDEKTAKQVEKIKAAKAKKSSTAKAPEARAKSDQTDASEKTEPKSSTKVAEAEKHGGVGGQAPPGARKGGGDFDEMEDTKPAAEVAADLEDEFG